jgi:tRNA-dihydrouridine synthase 3
MNIVERAAKGCCILAPLTKGGNLPFRRLCTEVFGAEVTLSEMAYARYIVKGESRERALLRKHASEKCFGVQLAALQVEEALEAAKVARDMGADFIDINCGCPIDDVVRRGLGAALLRRPKALFRLVEHLANNLDIPVTVKIRTGFSEKDLNALEIARGVEAAGAKVLTIHGRTREQRYSRSADWGLIGAVAAEVKIPVIGNGDIITYYEAQAKKAVANVASVMLGRGALIKPWLFKEIAEQKTYNFSSIERIEIMLKFTEFLKEHFGNDELGHKRIMKFLPWHLELFSRYQYLPEEQYQALSIEHPLLQSRLNLNHAKDDLLGQLLNNNQASLHQEMSLILLGEDSIESVQGQFLQLAERNQQNNIDIIEQPRNENFREVAG